MIRGEAETGNQIFDLCAGAARERHRFWPGLPGLEQDSLVQQVSESAS